MNKPENLLILPSIENIDEIINRINKPINVTNGTYSNVSIHFIENKMVVHHKGIDLRNYSYVWLSSFWGSRDLAYAIRLFLDDNKIPHTYVEESSSKVTDQVKFSINNLPSPNSIFIDIKKIEQYIDKIEEICKYPLVVKDIKGSRGKNSIYVSNRSELINDIPKLNPHRKYIIQEYIPNEYDWGVLIANEQIVSAEKSFPKNNEFRNNACNGAKEIFTKIEDIPESVKKLAYKASKALGLNWSRSDIIVDKYTGKPYLLEVNRCPGITSNSSEVNGAKVFLSSFIKSANQFEIQ